jgi:hypothetical protein
LLKLAYAYQEKLDKMWQSIVFTEKYQFYNYGTYWNYRIKVDDGSWDRIQMVSVDKNDNVLGYLSATCDRTANKISAVGAINFAGVNLTFSKDFYDFLSSLFNKFGFRKIEWCVVIGNPAEKLYDKIIKKYGGRVVGVQHESTVVSDGTVCDVKEYELFKRDYDSHI